MEQHITPSLKNLTCDKFGKPPTRHNAVLQSLGTPHVESFNYGMKEALSLAVEHMEPLEFILPATGDKVKWKLQNCVLHPPIVHNSIVAVKSTKIFPTECRQRGASYRGMLTGTLQWWLNDQQKQSIKINFGEVPIMVKSSLCHLAGLSPKELVAHGEDEDIWGGYFVIKGNERLVRMLVQTRSNYPVIMHRGGWRARGALFSDLGVLVRCVADDLRATNNVLHFVNDGTAKYMFSLEKSLYFVPMIIILKSLMDVTDEYIFQQLLLGCEGDLYYQSCVMQMLRTLHEEGIHNHRDAKNFLGKTFKIKIRFVSESCSNFELSDILFRQCIAIHLPNYVDKFHFICLMSRKLFSAAQNKCKSESTDAVMLQEVQLGGFLFQQYVVERLVQWGRTLRAVILKRAQRAGKNFKFDEQELLKHTKYCSLEHTMETFLATGNINTITGMGLMQDKGLTIVAENINRMRYMSHFRAVHRGSFFMTMRTTEARQLLPDAWGFICPVHTPDGAPCGLLNHLTRHCQIVTRPCDTSKLPDVLVSLGMQPLGSGGGLKASGHYFITLDGKVLGIVSHELGPTLVNKLRLLKTQEDRVPKMLEIVLVPYEEGIVGQYPGIFLFSNVSRMMRPVLHLASQKIEMIGTFEQVYLNIAVTQSEIIPEVTTHLEISETTFLSNLACLIPMPDCNQSPRNMYQCQMGKQSMGNPVHTWHLQSNCKVYRLQTPASPLFRPTMYDAIDLDTHAMGVNAIVAVISYTGYDMEDAMIINKSSYERGFAHGSIYKSEFVDIEPGSYFARDPEKPQLAEHLDADGLPYVGSVLNEQDPLCCYFDQEKSCFQVKRYHGKETVYVDHVTQCGCPIVSNKPQPSKACITFRVPRNPTVGDKFASRAGQKGICSQKWPAEDLPFTESGIVPDIVFNPHGFPSRMTIAMMVELMAGKSAAVHGLVHDATPFRFSEEDTAIDYFGKLLQEAGYNFHGTERMYSGVDGREMKADIFFGIVYYQRLRHMVSDKWQVRSTGPIDAVTHQPLKGRRRGGGVRFGEMERDALISHGAAFLLQDRLLHCSDKSLNPICKDCGSILSPITAPTNARDVSGKMAKPHCHSCGENSRIEHLEVPHVLRLLAAQFAAVNIKVKFGISNSNSVIK